MHERNRGNPAASVPPPLAGLKQAMSKPRHRRGDRLDVEDGMVFYGYLTCQEVHDKLVGLGYWKDEHPLPALWQERWRWGLCLCGEGHVRDGWPGEGRGTFPVTVLL